LLAKNKRVISGYNLADMRLQEWIDWKSHGALQIFIGAMKRLSQCLKRNPERWLKFIRTFGLDNLLASFAWSEVNVKIKYIGDTERFKRVDWWELPTECYNWMQGDCEDSTFLLTSALEIIQRLTGRKPDWHFAVLGYYRDGAQYFGHGYCLFYNTYLSSWNTLETTWDTEVNPLIWLKWNPEQYVPAILFNRSRVYRMDVSSHRRLMALDNAWYERHRDAIHAMIKYVMVGAKLKVPWMHKDKRPVPLRLKNLEVMV